MKEPSRARKNKSTKIIYLFGRRVLKDFFLSVLDVLNGRSARATDRAKKISVTEYNKRRSQTPEL
jgi:hypothetical protein